MERRQAVTALSALLISACTFGSNAAELNVARLPQGAPIIVQSFASSYSGELLAVRPSGLVVKERSGRIIVIPLDRVQSFKVENMGPAYAKVAGSPRTESLMSRLAGVSHFPQGITPAIEASLLAQSGLAGFVVVQ